MLAVDFNARSVDNLEREATVEPLTICGCRGDGADGSTRVDHEVFSGITLTNENHVALRRFTRPSVPVSRKGARGTASLGVFSERLVVPA